MARSFIKVGLLKTSSIKSSRNIFNLSPWIFLFFVCQSVGGKTVSVSTQTSQCSYTVIVNEFDVSKCSTSGEHAQADGVEFQSKKSSGNPQHRTKNDNYDSGNAQNVKESGYLPYGIKSSDHVAEDVHVKSNHDIRTGSSPSDNANVAGLNNLIKDMESKLLDEMVRSRELNFTLSRHEQLLSSAQAALESYKANFSSVFRTMMLLERKLQGQRKINKSLDKKLSNVILDVVEVNNVLANKLPTGDAAKSSKKFAVESSSVIRSCPGISDSSNQYKDCKEVYEAGHHNSDVYYIKPIYSACPIPVWCDMESPKGGWLVFQRRRDGSVDFNKRWHEYRSGFGDVSAEHWLGNDNLFLLTNQGRYQLRIDLWDFSGNRVHALYSEFKIDGERDGYKIHVSGYTGRPHDSLHRHNNRMFSTPDRDNDARKEASCAQEWEAGWWFDHCWFALLNGPYQNRSEVSWRGLAWNAWKREQLKASEMKIRPLHDHLFVQDKK